MDKLAAKANAKQSRPGDARGLSGLVKNFFDFALDEFFCVHCRMEQRGGISQEPAAMKSGELPVLAGAGWARWYGAVGLVLSLIVGLALDLAAGRTIVSRALVAGCSSGSCVAAGIGEMVVGVRAAVVGRGVDCQVGDGAGWLVSLGGGNALLGRWAGNGTPTGDVVVRATLAGWTCARLAAGGMQGNNRQQFGLSDGG